MSSDFGTLRDHAGSVIFEAGKGNGDEDRHHQPEEPQRVVNQIDDMLGARFFFFIFLQRFGSLQTLGNLVRLCLRLRLALTARARFGVCFGFSF